MTAHGKLYISISRMQRIFSIPYNVLLAVSARVAWFWVVLTVQIGQQLTDWMAGVDSISSKRSLYVVCTRSGSFVKFEKDKWPGCEKYPILTQCLYEGTSSSIIYWLFVYPYTFPLCENNHAFDFESVSSRMYVGIIDLGHQAISFIRNFLDILTDKSLVSGALHSAWYK